MTPRPVDGYAVILHLIEAARAVAADDDVQPQDDIMRNLRSWIEKLESYLAAEIPDEQVAGWEARTWGEVLPGDRVNAGGGELLVKQSAVLNWHVDPERREWHEGRDAVDDETGGPKRCRSCKGRCRLPGRGFINFALEHSQTRVTLEHDGREQTFGMPTGDEIEVLRGPAGIVADQAVGRHVGTIQADRDMVLASWAAEAYELLQVTGLSPEPVAMTMEGKA